jgi:hypothetical protein
MQGQRFLSLVHSIQTGSLAKPACYPIKDLYSIGNGMYGALTTAFSAADVENNKFWSHITTRLYDVVLKYRDKFLSRVTLPD